MVLLLLKLKGHINVVEENGYLAYKMYLCPAENSPRDLGRIRAFRVFPIGRAHITSGHFQPSTNRYIHFFSDRHFPFSATKKTIFFQNEMDDLPALLRYR